MSEPKFYRKKPVVIEARRYDGDDVEMQLWCESFESEETRLYFSEVEPEDRIEDPEIVAEVWDKLHSTWVGVRVGDWIIRGVQGEFYPCADDVFRETYEEADDE